MYQDIIGVLATDDYYTVKKSINKLINDGSFMKEIVKVHNPIVFDRFVKMCEYKIDTGVLYEERNKFIRKFILTLNKDNIYQFFDIDELADLRKEVIANRYLTEYIVTYYFGDNYYNFMTNFYQMVKYLRVSKKNLIDTIHLEIYRQFVDLKDMTFEDKIALFNKYLNDNLMEMFYDDMNIAREDSHKELVDKTLKLNHESSLYHGDISKRLGVDVYYLDGEEFFGFIRCLAIKSDDRKNNTSYIKSTDNRLGYSFSYIGNNNIGTIDYDGKNVALFYDNIDYKNIMYVHHADLHAKKMDIQNDYLSEKENEIVTPEALISHTNNYNEIYVKSGRGGIKPTALVCYDQITNHDIDFAKQYNLAILVINRKKYKRYETYEDEFDSYTYNI